MILKYYCECKNEKELNLSHLSEKGRDKEYLPMQERLLLLLTIYPEGQEHVPPSGEAWQRCSQLREEHFQIPDQWKQKTRTRIWYLS